jgi:cyclophilin family peptidyl-prolyl cis-trans isomerase
MSMANSRPNTNVSQFFVTYAAVNASASASVVDYRSHQMNAGLEVVENHRLDGVVYFADEEGVYSLLLFDRLRKIRCPFAQISRLQIESNEWNC